MNREIWFWLILMFITSLIAYYHLHWKITTALFFSGLFMSIKALIEDYFYRLIEEEQESKKR